MNQRKTLQIVTQFIETNKKYLNETIYPGIFDKSKYHSTQGECTFYTA